MFGRRLADDAHEAWRWGSIRFLALGGVCQTVVVTCPAQVAQHVPEWAWQALSMFSVFCMIAAGVARVTTSQEKRDVQHSNTTDFGR
jgi:hypothetical protein